MNKYKLNLFNEKEQKYQNKFEELRDIIFSPFVQVFYYLRLTPNHISLFSLVPLIILVSYVYIYIYI